MNRPPKESLMLRAGRMAVIALIYYGTARLSLRLALVGESVTPLWPPTGIALVAFLWFGARVWPAVGVAAFLVNLPISSSAAVAAGIAAGNTVAPLVSRRLLVGLDFDERLERLRDVLALVAAGALVAMTISATAGSLSLLASGAIASRDFGSTWSVWWAGDAMGILAVAPFLFSMRRVRLDGPLVRRRAGEALVLFGGLGLGSYALHRTAAPVWVVVFPLLGWVAWRFRQLGAGPAALIVIVTASWAAARDAGPFAGTGLLPKMFMLQVFNAAVAFTSFFFAAVVAARERAVVDQRRSLEREREAQARLYERERHIAETLQRSLLPERLPEVPDIEAAARYIPASSDLVVGGDWYDIIVMQDGRLGIAIGDVAGHGVTAAAAMGQVRSAFRAYLLEGLTPARTLERLNALLRELLPGSMATLVCGWLDPDTGKVTMARAGHPPPLLVHEDGAVELIEGGVAPPLGVVAGIGTTDALLALPVGGALFFYTDGLVERRRESLDQGLLRLQTALTPLTDLETVCDRVVQRLLGEGPVPDDAVLLAIRRVSLAGRPIQLELPAQPERLGGIRRVLGRWLRQNGASDRDISDILVACTEACSNVIQHAYVAHNGIMEIVGEIGDGALTLSVRDFGSWMSPAPSAGGRGLMLMRGLMDSVEVSPLSEGTRVTMRRRLGVEP